MDHQPLSLPMYAIAYRMSIRFSEHTFQMMRAVTRDSTKVSAMQGQHIICNNVLQHLLEAVGTGFMPAMTSKRGSPKDRGRIEGWDQCPLGYTNPDENETIAIIDGALESLITDLRKPLKRKGTGGKPFTIWREDLKVTARNPLVLTRVAKRKARASSFLDSFPGWMDNYDALPHPLGPNGLGTTGSAGDPGEPPECQDTNNQRFDALLRCLPGRDQRFVHKGELEPDKQDNDDGYISDDDCVAVLFDMTSGPAKKQRKYQVFYGNVAKLTRDRSGRQVPGPRVHINDGGKAACKWFDEKLDKHSKPVTHDGKRAFHLTLNNPAGFTDEVNFANILSGVRMTLD
ncbi:TPA: hypothetical protein ACH3X1_005033 [Trebouxia sp. C0004]